MKQIVKINHVGLRVSNLTKTKEFYKKLGFNFIVGPIGPEPVAVIEHPCGININLILNGESDDTNQNILYDIAKKYSGFTHIALEITDRLEVENHLLAHNIPITETIELPDGTVFFFVRDPDNNVIEFHLPKN